MPAVERLNHASLCVHALCVGCGAPERAWRVEWRERARGSRGARARAGSFERYIYAESAVALESVGPLAPASRTAIVVRRGRLAATTPRETRLHAEMPVAGVRP